MKTRAVHCMQEKYDIYIGRSNKWGNPFSHEEATNAKYKVATKEEAVKKYKEWLLTQDDLLNSLHELKGKTLGCWNVEEGNVLVELVEKNEA